MSWLLLATLGQFINAVVAVLDKYIVTDEKIMPRPFVYAFYSCLMTGGWVLIFILGMIPGIARYGVPQLSSVQMPTIQVAGMAFLAAYTFFMALVSMFTALKNNDASNVMPVIGAISAVCAFIFSYLFFDQTLASNFYGGLALLIIGTLLVSHINFENTLLLHSVHSGLFFALHYIALKGLFLETSFDDGFFWSRVAFVLFALSLLLVPSYLEKIKAQTATTTKKGGVLILSTKILAGIAAFMLIKATHLADVGNISVIQAMDGLKFVFIILFGVFFGRLLPETAGENDGSVQGNIRKIFAVIIISIGFALLFV